MQRLLHATCCHKINFKLNHLPLIEHEVPRVDYEKFSSDRLGESLVSTRAQVQAARKRQQIRFEETDVVCNSDMRVAEVRQFCKLDEAGDSLVQPACQQGSFLFTLCCYH